MSNELTTKLTFEQKLEQRIRESIGDLMADEDLTKLVNRAVEKLFFEPRKVSNGYREELHPSWLEDTVKTLVGDKMLEAVKAYVAEHQDEVQRLVRETLEVQAGALVMAAMNNMFSQMLDPIRQQIYSQVYSMSQYLQANGVYRP